MELLQELYALLETSEDREFSLKRVLAEEQIKHGVVVHLAALPVRISHCDLI